MVNCTSKTYQMKREIFTVVENSSRTASQTAKKVYCWHPYGILGSHIFSHTRHVDHYMSIPETPQCDRLSRHLSKGTPKDALRAYLTHIKKWCPDHPVIHIDAVRSKTDVIYSTPLAG